MNGVVAQLIALTGHGNLCLSASNAASTPLSSNSTFQFVNEVKFVRLGPLLGRLRQRVVAETPEAWYETLRDQGVTRLFLSRTIASAISIRDLGFRTVLIGDEKPVIVANRRGATSDLWVADWRVSSLHASDRRIWSVRYTAESGPPPFPEIGRDNLAWASELLATRLAETILFAAGHGLGTWVPRFERAERLLSGAESEPPSHPDLLPQLGYSASAQQLLNACVGAWVFGGMGSWNDNQPDDSAGVPTYHELTKSLFDAVMNGLIAAVNAFETPRTVAA